jgi:hypothetical protein
MGPSLKLERDVGFDGLLKNLWKMPIGGLTEIGGKDVSFDGL